MYVIVELSSWPKTPWPGRPKRRTDHYNYSLFGGVLIEVGIVGGAKNKTFDIGTAGHDFNFLKHDDEGRVLLVFPLQFHIQLSAFAGIFLKQCSIGLFGHFRYIPGISPGEWVGLGTV